jgi:hypothetical protein
MDMHPIHRRIAAYRKFLHENNLDRTEQDDLGNLEVDRIMSPIAI